MNKKAHLVTELKKHAEENYSNGYDIFVECYTDLELLELISDCDDFGDCVVLCDEIVSVTNERRKSAM